MPQPLSLMVESIEFFMRNLVMRLPFRYGNACLTASPILHVRLRARGSNGATAAGVSADILPPKWFDKSPEKDYRRNIHDLLEAAHLGAYWFQHYSTTPQPLFDLWHHAQAHTLNKALASGLNGLTGSFGASIIERAVIDAACRLAGRPYHNLLRANAFGVRPELVHAELEGVAPADITPAEPVRALWVRHTVGLGDPILDGDVTESERIGDGLPVSLEGWVREAGFAFFKLKVTGNSETDVARLERIVGLLEKVAPENYRVSLDGNEQFHDGGELGRWLSEIRARPALRRLLERTLFIEQPIERAAALDPSSAHVLAGAAQLPPVIIDESDDSLDAFKRSAGLGYRGTSVKNCKGVFKGLLNAMLVSHYTKAHGVEYLLSAEDLANQPIVPLQQDLCAISTLGIEHAERNGHQYGGTLRHLSPREREAALAIHGDLYKSHDDVGRWRIRGGRLEVGSIHGPGFGVGFSPDFEALVPLKDWDYDMLGLEE
jgi:hypothetical protein